MTEGFRPRSPRIRGYYQRGWRIWAQPKMTEKQNKKLKNNKWAKIYCILLYKVEILRISSLSHGHFLSPFSPSRRTFVRLTLCEEIRFAYRRHSAAKSKICLAEQSSLAPLWVNSQTCFAWLSGRRTKIFAPNSPIPLTRERLAQVFELELASFFVGSY